MIAHPGLPQIRTCRTTASGSSSDNFASHTNTRRESASLSVGIASTWSRSSVPPPRVLPTGLLLDASLSSTGSSRPSSPTSTVLSTRYDFLPPVPPHFVAFAWRYQGNTRVFAPAAGECCRLGPGVGHPVSPPGILPWRRQDLPRSWGTFVPMPCSSTPTGPTCQAVTTRRRGSRSEGSRIATFEAQSHSFSTSCLRFAAWVTP